MGPLGGHNDSRASGLVISAWCLLVGTVTVGQADLREASDASWRARSRQGKQSAIGEPVVTWWTHNRNGLFSSGHEHPGTDSRQRRGGDKSWRDVVEAEVG